MANRLIKSISADKILRFALIRYFAGFSFFNMVPLYMFGKLYMSTFKLITFHTIWSILEEVMLRIINDGRQKREKPFSLSMYLLSHMHCILFLELSQESTFIYLV